jgi:phospholipase/carboxylesterase
MATARRSIAPWTCSLTSPRCLAGCLVSLGILAAAAACNRPPALQTLVRGGAGPPTIVLLHGYGSSAERWLPFVQTIRLPVGGRFIFPQAPSATVPPDGPPDGRAWWRLDLRSYIPAGERLPDLSAARPHGLRSAASSVEALIRRVKRSSGGPIVLGGFSQGAMVAADVAFESDAGIDALVLLSGTLVDETTWERHLSKRRRMPVFVSHGRADPVLSYVIADQFRAKLETAGLRVTWVPFEGGHEMPAVVIEALNKFLERLQPASQPTR